MKCIRWNPNQCTGLTRVSDDVAYTIVKNGGGVYVSKSEFKASKGIKVKVNNHGQIIRGHLRAKVAEKMDIPIKQQVIQEN